MKYCYFARNSITCPQVYSLPPVPKGPNFTEAVSGGIPECCLMVQLMVKHAEISDSTSII